MLQPTLWRNGGGIATTDGGDASGVTTIVAAPSGGDTELVWAEPAEVSGKVDEELAKLRLQEDIDAAAP